MIDKFFIIIHNDAAFIILDKNHVTASCYMITVESVVYFSFCYIFACSLMILKFACFCMGVFNVLVSSSSVVIDIGKIKFNYFKLLASIDLACLHVIRWLIMLCMYLFEQCKSRSRETFVLLCYSTHKLCSSKAQAMI